MAERDPAASGSLLAAYVAVDALEHRLKLQVEMLTGAATELTELHELQDYATSCEGRIAELQTVLEDAERDWDELDSRHQEQSTVVQSQARRIQDLEQTLACTKAVTAAFEAREKENQSLREQWEVLTSAALIRDTALAKAQADVRRLESQNQRLSASSVDFADRLAATKADREKISAASLQMGNAAKDKATRLVKERDFYKSELDTLQNLVA